MRRKNKALMPIIAVWIVVVVVGIFVYLTLINPLVRAQKRITTLKAIAKKTFDAAKTQQLDALEKGLKELENEVQASAQDLKPVFAYQHLPFIGYVFRDAQNATFAGEYLLKAGEKMVAAITPYADLIGFKKGSQFSQQPTEKRLETAILTIDKLVPQIDAIDADLEKARDLLVKIDPEKYPTTFFGKPVKEMVKNYHGQILGLVTIVTDAKPLFKKLPYILGKDAERKYLVLFQNDAELRPTGGFLTAYAVFSIDKGQIRVKESSDIYDLDNTISHPAAPEEIQRYHLNVNTFNIRDSNLSPDLVTSIGLFEGLLAKSSRSLDYDGIFTIDTQVLTSILEVLGPTEAGGVTFKSDIDARCDCPQVIYTLEDMITRPTGYLREQRKSMLSVLLFNIMQKSLGVSPSKYWGRLIQVFLTELQEKHILVNLDDKDSQKAVESLGFGGRIVAYNGDYLHINNTNFAGAKSNMYVKDTVTSKTELKGDTYVREITVKYQNDYAGSDCSLLRGGLCLNAPLRNWVRVYVPLGAKLTSFVGSEMKVRSYEDLGKQVFEGFLVVNPKSQSTIKIVYELPKSVIKTEKYSLMIQKQPGMDEVKTTVEYNGKQQTDDGKIDRTFVF
ncbi:MAG: DUF4012 domain-containing protein [Patescibacteria group bacterium]|jgi:hypothetical protein